MRKREDIIKMDIDKMLNKIYPVGKSIGVSGTLKKMKQKSRKKKTLKQEGKILGGLHKGQNIYDKRGHYVGYCQCGCEECRQGDYHCQGVICKGD